MTATPFGNPDGPTDTPPLEQPSIVDTILTLDTFLSSDVRRAEKTARFYTRPDIEAEMENLTAELEKLVDSQGRPKAVVDASMADGARSAQAVILEIDALEATYAEHEATVRLKAMDEDDWTAFQVRHKAAMSEGPPFPPAFYEDMILSSEPMITMPGGKPEPVSGEQLRKLRKALGHAAFNAIAQAAWDANTQSGVSVPKSSLSSAVQRRIEQG